MRTAKGTLVQVLEMLFLNDIAPNVSTAVPASAAKPKIAAAAAAAKPTVPSVPAAAATAAAAAAVTRAIKARPMPPNKSPTSYNVINLIDSDEDENEEYYNRGRNRHHGRSHHDDDDDDEYDSYEDDDEEKERYSSIAHYTTVPVLAPPTVVIPPQYLPLFTSVAKQYALDLGFVAESFFKTNYNRNAAMQLIDQYHVDLIEAKQMDQIRLCSEATAVQDYSQAKRHRAQTLSTAKGALEDFAESVFGKHVPQVKPLLGSAQDCLARSVLIQLLDEEKKAIKWYKEPARSYMRSRAQTLGATFGPEQLSAELQTLKRILYEKSSKGGAPPELLEAFDLENGRNPAASSTIVLD
ncbi:hypothetical protein BASA81_001084 [Batrachochytrium salamandrivorans]|nr:hypothetical protein BASA81_001084 [Batrachochytrium salamandrivorans]